MAPSAGLTAGGFTGVIDTVTAEVPGGATMPPALTMTWACGVLGLSASSKVLARSAAEKVCDAEGGPGWAPNIVYWGGRQMPS